MLVRFLAAALIGWTAVELGMDLAAHHFNPQKYPAVNWTGLIEDGVPAVLGILLLIKAKPAAEWISDKLDL